MTGQSDRVSRSFLPWGSSLLLHALVFLLLPWVAVVTVSPQSPQGVEVELVSLRPGGGGAASRGHKAPAAPIPSPRPPVPDENISARRATEAPKPVEAIVKQPPPKPVVPEASDVPPTPAPGVNEALPRTAGEDNTETGPLARNESADVTGPSDGQVGEARGVGTRLSAVPGPMGGPGEGFGGRGLNWLQLLRRRIEGAKQYPLQARRLGMEGTVEVEFRIAWDGSAEAVTVVKSSGYPLLDEASVDAIKRAAPLPVVHGRIRVPISYRLRTDQ